MDAMDSSGEHQTDIEHTIFKRRVDAQGNPMADNEKIVVGKIYNNKPSYC